MANDNVTNAVNEEPKPGTKAYMEAELAAAMAEIEALKAKAAENETTMAGSEAPKVSDPERVDIFVEKGYANDEPNLIISINGVMYLLPKGKTSSVPKFVADEYYRSRKAQQRYDETVEKMLEEASK